MLAAYTNIGMQRDDVLHSNAGFALRPVAPRADRFRQRADTANREWELGLSKPARCCLTKNQLDDAARVPTISNDSARSDGIALGDMHEVILELAGMSSVGAVLVTGGAGYVGSHVVLALHDANVEVVVLDDLSTGQRQSVPRGVEVIVGDVGDRNLISRIASSHRISTIMHFAGSIVVHESLVKPLEYYRNNTVKSHALIEACLDAGIGEFVFSSTAAVYGIPTELPVREDARGQPINPYGSSKLMTEWFLRDVAAAHNLRYVILRYFNVAGADPQGRAGQSTPNATHLIKVACESAVGARAGIAIYGDDYDTKDGTAIRDYIHVTDLATAHVLAWRYLREGAPSTTLNCGYGRGSSVREVLSAVEAAANMTLKKSLAPRRPGDPAVLIANAEQIKQVLGWRPCYDDLGFIVQSALSWERRLRGL